MIITYIVCKDKEEAEKISTELINKRLVGCVNMFPIKAMFWWKEKVEKASEYAIIAKTFEHKFEEIKNCVKKLHSYEVPAILKFKVDAEENYENWLKKEVK